MDTIIGDRSRFTIRQKKEWGEIALGFETRNRYTILDDDGAELGSAAEQAGGIGATLARNFLGSARACTIHVYNASGLEVGRGEKPFRLFFYEMDAYDGDRKIGSVKRRFSILHRKFSVYDPQGNEIMTLISPLFRIWTFKLAIGEREVGRISKRWGGVLKEMFTDADTFGLEFFGSDVPPDVKKLLLVGTFLVDFTCFEKKGG